jgi:hypothetical protein
MNNPEYDVDNCIDTFKYDLSTMLEYYNINFDVEDEVQYFCDRLHKKIEEHYLDIKVDLYNLNDGHPYYQDSKIYVHDNNEYREIDSLSDCESTWYVFDGVDYVELDYNDLNNDNDWNSSCSSDESSSDDD